MTEENRNRGLYVGCALTPPTPKSFVAGVESIKEALKEEGYSVLDFVGQNPATPQEVFDWDINCVRKCDAMLAIVDYPSQGLGWEMATAGQLGKPTLLVAQAERVVSRFTLGAAASLPNFEFSRYHDLEEVVERTSRFLGRVALSRLASI